MVDREGYGWGTMPCANVISGAECSECGLVIEPWDDVLWSGQPGLHVIIHQRCLSNFLDTMGKEVIKAGVIKGGGDGTFHRLMAFQPEMGYSDWEILRVDVDGNWEHVGYVSRPEFGHKDSRAHAAEAYAVCEDVNPEKVCLEEGI